MAVGGNKTASGGTTRLDRLLILLDTGEAATTRDTAARQIGELASLHRADLHALIRRVKRLLKSSKWDTRVAAAKALGYIARNTPHPTVQDLQSAAAAASADGGGAIAARTGTAAAAPDAEGAALAAAGTTAPGGGLRFDGFDIGRVLDNGAPLVASAGKEYDIAAVGRGGKEAIAKQKQSLRRRLGLDECERFMDVSDIIRDEDLEAPAQAAALPASASAAAAGSSDQASAAGSKQKQQQKRGSAAGSKRGAQDLMAEMLPIGTSAGAGDGGSAAGSGPPALAKSLSARERNLLKRKAKSLSKEGGKRGGGAHGGVGEEDEEDEGEGERGGRKKMRTKSVVSDGKEDNKITVEQVAAEGDDWEDEEEEEGEWPLQSLCEQLLTDMFHPVWEVRHGSIFALREVLSAHGNSAAVCRPVVPSKWASANGKEERDDEKEKTELEEGGEGEAGKTVPESKELDVGVVKAVMGRMKEEEEGVKEEMEEGDHGGLKREELAEEGMGGIKREVKEEEFLSERVGAVKMEVEEKAGPKAEVKEKAKGEEGTVRSRVKEEAKGEEDQIGVKEGWLEGVKREAKAEKKEESGGWLGLSMGHEASERPRKESREFASGGMSADGGGVRVKQEVGETGREEGRRVEGSGFDLNESMDCKTEAPETSVTNGEDVSAQKAGGRVRMGLDLHLSDGMEHEAEEKGGGSVGISGNEGSKEESEGAGSKDGGNERGSKSERSEEVVAKRLDLNMEVEEEGGEEKAVDEGEGAEEEKTAGEERALVVAGPVREVERSTGTAVGAAGKAHVAMEAARKAQIAMEAARKAQADNEHFLEDCAIRLLCIFALDRLEDFVSDQVVAPVREACGQALGVVLKYLPSKAVRHTLDVLLQMQTRSEWEVRHGALLGIKYLIAVRRELLPALLPSLLPACIRALQDSDDDVRAVAAEALLPAARAVGEGVEESDLRQLLRLLWGILSELDDLSPSTSSVMALLAELHALPRVAALWSVSPAAAAAKPAAGAAAAAGAVGRREDDEELGDDDDLDEDLEEEENVAPKGSRARGKVVASAAAVGTLDSLPALVDLVRRLWPLMRHNISAVRLAAVSTLERLLQSNGTTSAGSSAASSWVAGVLLDALACILRNLILETHPTALAVSRRVWSLLLQQVPPSTVAYLTRPVIRHWCQLIATPPGSSLNTSSLFATSAGGTASKGKEADLPSTGGRGTQAGGRGRGRGRGGRGKGKEKEIEGGGAGTSAGSSAAAVSAVGSGGNGVVVVGADGESAAVRIRVDTSRAMGLLLSFWPVDQLEGAVAPLVSLLGSAAATQKQVGALIIAAWFRELEGRQVGEVEGQQTDEQRKKQELNTQQQQQQQQQQQNAISLSSLPSLSFARPSPPVARLLTQLMALLSSPDAGQSYEELSRTYSKLRAEASALLSHARAVGVAQDVIGSALTRAGCGDSAVAFSSGTAGGARGGGGAEGGAGGGEEGNPFERLSPEGALELAGALAGLAGAETGELEKRDAPGAAAAAAGGGDLMESCRRRLLSTANYLRTVQTNMHTSVTATVAAAAVRVAPSLPSKLNPIIQPLMAALKREREELLQQSVASGLAAVILRSLDRRPSPNDRLLKNLSTLACSDPSQCPPPCDANREVDDPLDASLAAPAVAGAGGAAAGGPAAKGAAGVTVKGEGSAGSLEAMIGRRGAELSFRALADSLGPDLFSKLPKLWDLLTEVWKPGEPEGGGTPGRCDEKELFKSDPQALVNTFQLVRCIAPVLHTSLIPRLLLLLPPVLSSTRHPHAAVRFASAQCLSTLVSLPTAEQPVLSAILTHVLPQLTNTLSEPARRGAACVVSLLVNTRGEMLAPYAALLVVPLLARMSDPSPQVRQLVTQSFARLVPLLPLARGLPLPAFLDEEGARKAREDARFLEQLLDNRKADDYQLQVKLSVTLRRYQQEGINWLAFLRRFHLHGVLCDDMGLGKTLQASSMIASDTLERQSAARVAASGSTAAAAGAAGAAGASGPGHASAPLLPCLIVCPPTLVAHWVYEIEKYIPPGILHPLQYAGSTADRQRLRGQLKRHNLVVTSYEVLRSDIDELAALTWRYCVLDEGHLIKGAKTRLSQAVRRIKAEHRLLLTGTPIQNNVLELWALFDFLMPGFLGTEKQFQARYGKPLQAARDPKCTAKQAEAGALAMEALHRQVMPFILRRTKEQVLSDLPPKIITDRYCQLSTLQRLLYADFAKSHASEEVVTAVTAEGAGAGGGGEQASTHVFQALQYLRKLCSHPLLVLDPSHPRHAAALTAVGATGQGGGSSSGGGGGSSGDGSGDVHDIVHAPKLIALRDILLECGIGGGGEGRSGGDVGSEASEGNHRVLVFAQLKSFLDIVEQDLFKKHMPSVSYLRIDGSVEPSRRFDLVKAFNSDPTIDVLLLTTHVGGLGLNLTAADTVVFLEHDWNPMRDLQAMDRAHRLGQRRTVNVHRVIMAGTLEEKVMGLQRFKLSIANAVVNADNASLKSMDTSQLLDLFNAGPPAAGAAAKRSADASSDAAVAAAGGGKGLKAVLTGLEDLWDESQYAEEYNLDNFLKRI
ncbi:hypothetical protein CLOM_g8529 [Closterium sp. NIES-68]|nr:hypothetical protein CLOM_g8529 [Closterium sp. NIES-68]GJP83765.1 hypothetical protein CLOP_g13878 [Closterium sp. NIES-67]